MYRFHLLKQYLLKIITTQIKTIFIGVKVVFLLAENTSIASTKEVNTNALTFGLDKFTDDYGLEGFAFRLGSDDVDVGSAGSNLTPIHIILLIIVHLLLKMTLNT